MSQDGKVKTAMENLKQTKELVTDPQKGVFSGFFPGVREKTDTGVVKADRSKTPTFGQPPQQTEGQPPQQTEEKEEEVEEGGKEQQGGVMHWLGLAGGRKRRRKKSRKKKKKSKSKKRRRKSRKRRGGFACPSDKCPCPPMSMFNSKKKKERKMCVDKRASGRAHWFNYKYGKPGGNTYFERQTYVNDPNNGLKEKREAFVAEGKAIRQANYKKAEGFSDFARGDGGVATAAAALKMAGVNNIGVGGRRRKSRRKKRRKSKKRKSRRRRKKSRRRRSRRRRR